MKWTAFGKTKPRPVKAQAKEDSSKEHDEAKAKDLKTKETGRLEAEISKFKAKNQGRAAKVFKMPSEITKQIR